MLLGMASKDTCQGIFAFSLSSILLGFRSPKNSAPVENSGCIVFLQCKLSDIGLSYGAMAGPLYNCAEDGG
jgi:hypothetical protein